MVSRRGSIGKGRVIVDGCAFEPEPQRLPMDPEDHLQRHQRKAQERRRQASPRDGNALHHEGRVEQRAVDHRVGRVT